MIRKIVQIDQDKCNGCGLCIPNCVEGALKIVDGKARLVSDKYCDGLGACLGHCPQDAITIIERDAEEFDEKAVEEFLSREKKLHGNQEKGNTIHHNHGSCPGSKMMVLDTNDGEDSRIKVKSQLRQWPVQLKLVPVNAPYFDNADLLITADCVPYAYANYHQELLKGKTVVVGCPKLDDIEYYTEKLTEIIKYNNIKSITVAIMEVPCCGGLVRAVEKALALSDKKVPIKTVKVGIRGEII